MSNNKNNLLDVLLQENLILEEQAEQIKQKSKESKKDLEEVIRSLKIVDEEELAKVKAKILNIPYVDLSSKAIAPEILRIISEEIAKNYQMISFAKINSELRVALVEPQNFRAIEAIEFLAKKQGLKASYYLCSLLGFTNAFKKYQVLGDEVKEVLGEAEEKVVSLSGIASREPEMEEIVKTAPVSRTVDLIVRHAVEAGASDIHIEPGEKESKIRYRVDGVLKTYLKLPPTLHPAIVSRIKVLANLRLDETRIPQDGRIKLNVGGRAVDFRISVLPLINKEKVVMRILDTSGVLPTLKELGFRGKYIEIIERNIQKPHGMFLITGPTGSGKTTTLYSALSILNQEGVNIVTLEDPVEYYLSGINQSQINTEVGLTFAAGLRAILRQDPNVIMVGEIRDSETAELAVHAGLTGHLVFSTLHTRDAFGAIPRLIDMKVEPFLLASTLNLVMAQRLVRTICENCKEEVKIPSELEEKVKIELASLPPSFRPSSSKFFRGRGCNRCNELGYKSRTTISEIIEISEELENLIAENKVEEIKMEFRKQGMITMKQDGILKALEGTTTVEEVMRATQE